MFGDPEAKESAHPWQSSNLEMLQPKYITGISQMSKCSNQLENILKLPPLQLRKCMLNLY